MSAAKNNPLHMSLFPAGARDAVEYSFLLSSCLDIFEARAPHKTADQDFGLLQAINERLAMYGWLTNTGVKFVVVVDMEGRHASDEAARGATSTGLRTADVKPVRPASSLPRLYSAALPDAGPFPSSPSASCS